MPCINLLADELKENEFSVSAVEEPVNTEIQEGDIAAEDVSNAEDPKETVDISEKVNGSDSGCTRFKWRNFV